MSPTGPMGFWRNRGGRHGASTRRIEASDRMNREAEASAWYTCSREARPFREIRQLPPELRVPRWFPAMLLTVTATGLGAGAMLAHPNPLGRLANAVLVASALVYATVSLLDLWEHFQLEKHVTGSYWTFEVIPLGESSIHAAVVSMLAFLLFGAQPLGTHLGATNWLILSAPLLFLILGWTDEIVYHRRRALHREDILHTVSHLAAGFLIFAVFMARVFDWRGIR